MDSTVTVAIVGVAGTLLAGGVVPMIQDVLGHRRAEKIRQQDRLSGLLEDAMRRAQLIEFSLVRLSDAYSRNTTSDAQWSVLRDAQVPEDLVTARMWLLAPHGLRDAWLHLLAAHNSLDFAIHEGDLGDALIGDRWHELDPDAGEIVAVREALSKFRVEASRAFS